MNPIQIKIAPPNPPDKLLAELSGTLLRYTDPLYLYHCIWLGDSSYCGVFGDGENGAYEWFIWSKERLQTSNKGYGSPLAALRSALDEVE